MGPNYQRTRTLSPFTIKLIFLWLSVIGLSVIPFLTIKLNPSRTYNTVSISFSWGSTSAEIVEQNITARLEAAVSTIKGLKEINSTSGNGFGSLYISFDPSADIKEVQYEIATLIRSLYKAFPQGVSYPQVYANRPSGNEARTLLNYFASAGVSSWELGQYLRQKVVPELSNIEGVYQVNVSGVHPRAISLRYNRKKLTDLGITEDDILSAVNTSLSAAEVGKIYLPDRNDSNRYAYLTLKMPEEEMPDWRSIPVKKSDGRIVFISDVATAAFTELPPSSYFRINGKNAVTLEISGGEKVNYLDLVVKLKARIEEIRRQMPQGYELVLAYDQTSFLRAELQKIIGRTSATVAILFLFVFLLIRSWRYLLFISISLTSNLLIAAIFYYILHIEIHLYTLAAITVSLGMIIDGTIVMIDHLRNTGNRKVFLALTGAHVTTIGSVCIIFLLSNEQRIYLEEFAWVMIINLAVSLPIALFLIPALMDRWPLDKRYTSAIGNKRAVLWWNKLYRAMIDKFRRRKAILSCVLLLSFGLPVFLLPANIDHPQHWWSTAYNSFMNWGDYPFNVKTLMDKWLGGTLGLFVRRSQDLIRPPGLRVDRTTLTVDIKMPKGATLQQMNLLAGEFEGFLGSYSEIDQFDCRVSSGQHAVITIRFLPRAEKDGFPAQLKKDLEAKAIYTGLADFTIQGVGQGFDNSMLPETMNYGIVLYGYNYDRLVRVADSVKGMLMQNDRVEKVSVRSTRTGPDGEQPEYEMVFNVLNRDQLLLTTGSNSTFNRSLHSLSTRHTGELTVPVHKAWIPLLVSTDDSLTTGVWTMQNQPIPTGKNEFVKLNAFSTIDKERIGSDILRLNQQYQLVVNYNFVGDYVLGTLVQDRIIREIKKRLPVGYSVQENQGFWNSAGLDLAYAVLITITIIFLLSAILLDSIRQALVVVAMIPVSFIGVFLVVQFFRFDFDEGGFASFILLSGIVVNWALFILNDYNNFRNKARFRNHPGLCFIKSFNYKIVPILLSATSSLLGFVPFLVNGRTEPFWYSLAICTIGGLLFSVLATIFIMPVFLPGEQHGMVFSKKEARW